MKFYAGIDLGTTNSTVSVISLPNDDSHPIHHLKQMPIYQFDANQNPLLNEYGLPSYLYLDIDNKMIHSGHYAKELYSSGNRPMQTVQGVKMRLGNDSVVQVPSIKDRSYYERFTMTQCSAIYLKTIRQSIIKQLHVNISDVVITIPTAFTAEERLATINAAKLAGFKNIHLIDEPTAALYWHVHNEDTDLLEHLQEKSQNVLVYDIGGGTLDISIANISLTQEVKHKSLKVKILGCSPRMDLGGNDFDQLLGAYFLYDYEKARKDLDNRNMEQQNQMIARLVSQAEKQKIAFNNKIRRFLNNPRRKYSEELTASFEVANNQSAYTVLTYEILQKVFSSLTDPAGNNTLTSAIRPALQKAKLQAEDIDEIVITGGMSQFYLVEECLKDYFSSYNIRFQFIDHIGSVSKGAAIYHYSLSKQQDGEIHHHDLRKLVVDDKMAENIYMRVGVKYIEMIPHTAPPNSSGVIKYIIQEDGLVEIPLFLYSGYGDSPLEYTRLGGQFIQLKQSMKKGETIPIKWKINEQKIIELIVEELADLNIESAYKEISNDNASNDEIHQYSINGRLFS
jgi:molecular chaperone DnaK